MKPTSRSAPTAARGVPTQQPLAIETEDRAAVMDSLILCKFLRGVFHDFYTEAAEMLAAVTGWPMTAMELKVLARRIVNARKCLNEREGWDRREDSLPARFLGGSDAQAGTSGLSRERFAAMVEAYYSERGWDRAGRVPRTLRRELEIDENAFG